MGCDAYANEDGEFKLEILEHETGMVLRRVEIVGLRPKEPLDIDIVEGEHR